MEGFLHTALHQALESWWSQACFVYWIRRHQQNAQHENPSDYVLSFGCLFGGGSHRCATDHICLVTCCWQMLSSHCSARMRLLEWIKITLPPQPIPSYTQQDFFFTLTLLVCLLCGGREASSQNYMHPLLLFRMSVF